MPRLRRRYGGKRPQRHVLRAGRRLVRSGRALRRVSAKKACGKKTVLLELGVGYNTPTIIRFPFERMTYENEGVSLIRMNADYPEAIEENEKKTVSFGEDMAEVLPAFAADELSN